MCVICCSLSFVVCYVLYDGCCLSFVVRGSLRVVCRCLLYGIHVMVVVVVCCCLLCVICCLSCDCVMFVCCCLLCCLVYDGHGLLFLLFVSCRVMVVGCCWLLVVGC